MTRRSRFARKGAQMPVLIHFEISADDLDRACDFYRTVFDWKIEKLDGPDDYRFVSTAEDELAVTGGLVERYHPADSTINTARASRRP